MNVFRRLLILLCAAVLAVSTLAGTVHVRGYYRKDGTYVHAYDRSSPGSGSSTSSQSADSDTGGGSNNVAATSAPSRLVRAPYPEVDPNWVPAKIVSGQYIAGHFKGDPSFAAIDHPTSTSRTSGTAHMRSVRAIPHHRSTSYHALRTETSYTSNAGVIERDSRGHIKRSESAKRRFMRMTGHPNGWPGHVVDHIVPLKRGGADDPSNMQWQTTEEAKAKDKRE